VTTDDGPPPDGRDPVSLAAWILASASRTTDQGGVEAIASVVASLPGEIPTERVEHARLLALGAYFGGRGDGARGGEARLARARQALERARPPAGEDRSFAPIGRVRSPWRSAAGMPLQTVAAKDAEGRVELLEVFAPAIRDLAGFSHVWLLTDLHRVAGYELEVVPFLDDRSRSLFATRSPRRPNPIGLSLVRVAGIEGATILVEELDLLDGTPVLDVKPYVPLFDARETTEIGWFSGAAERVFDVRSDDRYGNLPESNLPA
jgi:tRNA-Thr(GGU) m(6)t(6)A37 methyltransferase TsaA